MYKGSVYAAAASANDVLGKEMNSLLVTGSSCLIGSEFVAFFRRSRLVRFRCRQQHACGLLRRCRRYSLKSAAACQKISRIPFMLKASSAKRPNIGELRK